MATYACEEYTRARIRRIGGGGGERRNSFTKIERQNCEFQEMEMTNSNHMWRNKLHDVYKCVNTN